VVYNLWLLRIKFLHRKSKTLDHREIVMPIIINDLDDGLGVSITGQGALTDDEFGNALKSHLTQDQDKFKRYRYSLADYTNVTKVEVSIETVKYIANLCVSSAKVNPSVVHADVANQDLIFGLARMAEILRDLTGWESMVFRNRKDAEIWIKEKVKEKYGLSDLTMGSTRQRERRRR
jgi:hypothetical protein